MKIRDRTRQEKPTDNTRQGQNMNKNHKTQKKERQDRAYKS